MSTSIRSRRRTRRTIAGIRLLLPWRAVTRTCLLLPRRAITRRLRRPLVLPIALARRIVWLPCGRARPGRTERVPAVVPLVRRWPLSPRLARTRLAEPPEAFGAGRRRLVAARGLRRTRILGCPAGHARLAKPAEARLILGRSRRAAGSSLPGGSAGLRRGLLSAREEMHAVARMSNVGRLPVRELAAGRAGTDRHLSANRPCHAHLRSRYALDATEPPVAEILRADGRDAICHTRISINICDVYASNVNPTVEAADAVETAAPPGMEGFERSQRHP